MAATGKGPGCRTYELSEYLVDVLRCYGLGSVFTGEVTYHSSCHLLRDMGLSQPSRGNVISAKCRVQSS